jgi:hypothetical protein
LMLIVLGLGLYWMQYLEDTGESIVLTFMGGLGITAYLFTRFRFLLILGCIVLGLGIGSFGERHFLFWDEFSRIGLGIGFVLIYLIALLYERRSHWWPLVPGGVLFLLGFHAWHRFWVFILSGRGWPLILVIVGGLMLLGTLSRTRKKKRSDSGAA